MIYLVEYVVGFIVICLIFGFKDEKFVVFVWCFLWVFGWFFGFWCIWDGMGGIESLSVKCFVGDDLDLEFVCL